MRGLFFITAAIGTMSLSGCLAKAAFDVATAPVRAAGKAVDLATTSQSEADENRGREIRRREERLGKLQRQYEQEQQDCSNGDRRACEKAQKTYAEMQVLMPGVRAEPMRR